MHKCLYCNVETNNPKFCCLSHAAKYNNKNYPKRKTLRKCLVCGKTVSNYKFSRCDKHLKEFRESGVKNSTLGEYKNRKFVKGKHRSIIYVSIRGFAKQWNKELKNKSCANCGYNKHIEICHIKPIHTFSDDAKLKDINSPNNLIPLCPNCHWEFDNGLLKLL